MFKVCVVFVGKFGVVYCYVCVKGGDGGMVQVVGQIGGGVGGVKGVDCFNVIQIFVGFQLYGVWVMLE